MRVRPVFGGCNNVMPLVLLIVLGCGRVDQQDAAQTAGEELVNRSIAFHDPDDVWFQRTWRIRWYGTGSSGEERSNVELVLHPDQTLFELRGTFRGSTLEYTSEGSSWTATVNGSAELSTETKQAMRLDREDGLFWRSYYGFLAGLPMKLRDPGASVAADPVTTEFNGRNVTSVRVEYDAEVGSDTWYFYFDPNTAQLVGCRFYHDETANDGEYITMEGLIETGRLRLPRIRHWYVNADDRFLGSDELRSIEIVPSG